MYQKYEAYEIRLGNLLKIDQAILENKTLDQIAEIAIHGIVELFPGAWISITNIDKFSGEVSILAVESSGSYLEWTSGRVIPMQVLGDKNKLEDGQIFIVDDIEKDPIPDLVKGVLEAEKVTAYAVIPLVSQKMLIGTLHIGTKGEGSGFHKNEIEMLVGVGAQLAISIAQSQLNDENRARRDRLETLLDISTALSRSLNLSEVMQLTINEAVRVLGLETGAFYLLDGDSLYLGATIPAMPPDFPDVFRNAQLENHPHIKKTIESGDPLYLPDAVSADLTPEERSISVARGLRSLLYVPLAVDDRVTGVLIMGTVGRTQDFSQDEIDLCTTFSSQMALAVENARLHDKVKRHAFELEARVKERTAELEALTYSLSHDLRGPLRSIKGYGQILETEFSESLTEDGNEYLVRMINASRRLEAMLDGLLGLRQLGNKPFVPEELNLFEIAKRITLELIRQEPDREIEFEMGKCEGFCKSYVTDQSYMEILLTNLISNAVKFTNVRDVAKIEFGCFEDKNNVVFYIKDNGVGFDQKYVEELFIPFRSLHSRDAYPGFGIGMTVVKKIIDLHKGDIWVESEKNVGTSVFFTLNSMSK